jgi:competence protein ComEA
MRDVSRPQLVVYAAAAIAIALIGARYLHDGSGASGGSSSGSAGGAGVARAASGSSRSSGVRVQAAGDALVVVHVAGEVRRPGVYRLRASDRVQDAVKLAGGATRRANLDGLNLAAKLEDGRQIVVPRKGAGGAVADAGGGGSAGVAGAAGAGAAGPVNLNMASAEQLDGLDGVGPTTAQKIIAYREQHGGFGSVNELDRIPGIGEKRMAALRDQVTV